MLITLIASILIIFAVQLIAYERYRTGYKDGMAYWKEQSATFTVPKGITNISLYTEGRGSGGISK